MNDQFHAKKQDTVLSITKYINNRNCVLNQATFYMQKLLQGGSMFA